MLPIFFYVYVQSIRVTSHFKKANTAQPWQNHNLKDVLNGMYVTISLIYEDCINVSIKVLLDRNLQFTYVVGCLCEKQ